MINGFGSIGETTPFGTTHYGPIALINQSSGLLDANNSGNYFAIYIGGASSNAGTLRASNDGNLQILGGGGFTLTNSGTIAALDGSTVYIQFTGNGGSFTYAGAAGNQFMTAGSGLIRADNGVVLDGTAAPIVNNGAFECVDAQLQGTLTNNGLFSLMLGGGGSGLLVLSANATLNGSGMLTLVSDNIGNRGNIATLTAGLIFSNASTVNGAGNIGGDPNGFGFGALAVTNQAGGLIDANSPGQTLVIQATAGLSNAGTLRASNGGSLTITAGTLMNLAGSTLTGGTYVAQTGGTIDMQGATILANAAHITLDGTGSTFNAVNALANNSGEFDLLDRRSFSTTGDFLNSGKLEVGAGGSLTVAGHFTAAGGSVVGAGATLINGGLSVTAPAEFSGGGTVWILNGISVDPTASVDIANDLVIVEAGAGTRSALLTSIQSAVVYGRTHSSGGGGITSSTTAADTMHKTTVVVDNALLGLTQFGGQPVDANSILVESTWFGDSNLDRKVDVTDLGTLATNYGKSVPNGILQGDFNGDGKVDVTDLGLLATDYGLGTGGNPFAVSMTVVPEPGALAILSAWLMLAFRRRRYDIGRF
jgi:hypothetical protein